MSTRIFPAVAIVFLLSEVGTNTGEDRDVHLFASDNVRWAEVGKVIKKIVVRSNVISRHLPIGENSEEEIRNVVAERAAVVWEGCRAFGVVTQEVWQQPSCHLL